MDVLTLASICGAVLVTALALVITWDVHRKRVQNQSLGNAFRHYLSAKSMYLMGLFFRHQLIRATGNVQKAQTQFLLRQLRENGDTDYGRKYQLGSVGSVAEFQQRHPLTRYDHYAPFVMRMMEGKMGVLTRKQPDVFGVSSGTSSGSSKLIPMLRQQKSMFFLHAVTILYCCLAEAFPDTQNRMRKSLKIFYNPTWKTCSAGIKIGPNSSTPSSQKNILHMYSTPVSAFDIISEPEALYVHLLFALKDRHLGMIEGNFASLVYNAMVTLQRSVPDLARDIHLGTLNKELNIPSNVRQDLEKLLQPDPFRSEEIIQAFDQGIIGVCKRVWPDLGVVLTVDSGAFAPYADKLRSTFCLGVPLYSPIYAATEGLIGINLWAKELPSSYLPHPSVQFFEFIPVDKCDLEQPATLLLHELKYGEEYEIVLTNVSGLFRYRLGDVVKVTGFSKQCPILQFQYRVGQFLNVRGEKTPESLFYDTLCETVAQWSGLTMVDYCCAESILVDDVTEGTGSGHFAPCYHVFLELDCREKPASLSEDQIRMLDERLCEKSYVYSSFRKKGSIDVMKVHLLRHGAFHQLRDYVISTTEASSNQFKVPRVLKRKVFVEFLLRLKL